MGAYELYQEGILTENEYEMEHHAEIYEVLEFPYENESENYYSLD